MVAQKHRISYPDPASSSYSHISIQRAPDSTIAEELDASSSQTEEHFIRKDSLQTEIQDQLDYVGKLSANLQETSPPRALTFAEATMSTRKGKGRRNSGKDDDGSDATLSGPVSLESLGPFKYTFKKKKKVSKWSPLDLSATESASEFGSNSEFGSSRAVSPSPQNFNSTSSPPTLDFDKPTSVITPSKVNDKALGDNDNFEFDVDPTPTQERFDLSTRVFDSESGLDHIESDNSDTQSTKDREEAIMAGLSESFGSKANIGQDAFDSLDWDPDLPTASAPDGSPEPIVPTPKPVAYTTVGSLVDPTVVPQFTAPNRIQREGSGRRPLMSMMPTRHHDSYYPPRGPPPPLNIQNSMHYTQQLAQSPVSFNFSHTPPPKSANSSRSSRLSLPSTLTEQERQVLARMHGSGGPQMMAGNGFAGAGNGFACSGNGFAGSSHMFPGSGASVVSQSFSEKQDIGYNVKEVMDEEDSGRSQTAIQKLKMQTLQRLSKFENPLQDKARNFLSEFSVSKSNPTAILEALIRNKESSRNPNNLGELDRGYQFPPPGLAEPTTAQSNPLYGAYPALNDPAPKDHVPTRPPGYPQPLTAGPPGQRQYQAASKANQIPEQIWSNERQPPAFDIYASQPYSPWNNSNTPWATQPVKPQSGPMIDGFETTAEEYTAPIDTLPLPVISKYYPRGFPGDMTGKVRDMEYKTRIRMGEIIGEPPLPTKDEMNAKAMKDIDDAFYMGARRWGMTSDDHITEEEERQNSTVKDFGPIGPPKKSPAKDGITVNDKDMTTADAVRPVSHPFLGIRSCANSIPASRRSIRYSPQISIFKWTHLGEGIEQVRTGSALANR